VGIDLSKKNLAIAQRKLRLSRARDKISNLLRWLPGMPSKLPRKAPVFLHGHAERILNEPSLGEFDLIQCFGVLHHQPEPHVLLKAMASRLSPQGALRLMIYSYHGRSLERKIQQRYHHLWSRSAKRRYRGPSKVKLVLRFQLLRCWQLLNFTGILPSTRRRFRYLGLHRSAVADALMHPSDPGLPLDSLLDLAQQTGLEIVYCEGKVYGQGLLQGFENPKRTWHELVKADKRHDLLTNPLIIFKKRAP
jgi:SAM-dependent methyltransferase